MKQSHSHVALLIDADNISYTLVPLLLAQAAMFGEVSFRLETRRQASKGKPILVRRRRSPSSE